MFETVCVAPVEFASYETQNGYDNLIVTKFAPRRLFDEAKVLNIDDKRRLGVGEITSADNKLGTIQCCYQRR